MCVLVPEWFLLTLISSMPPAFFNSFNIYCHVAHLIPYFFLHFLCHLQLPMSAEKSVTSEVTSFTYLPIFACIIFEFHFSCSSLFHFIILFFFFLWFPWFCLLVHFFNICNMTFFFFFVSFACITCPGVTSQPKLWLFGRKTISSFWDERNLCLRNYES